MKALSKIFSHFSWKKSTGYTILGFAIVAFSIHIMVKAQSITQDGIELLLTGLMVSGFNHDAVKSIRNSANKPNNP